MVLDMARPKNKKSTMWPGMRGRDAARKSTLKVNILQVFTIDFSEIQFFVNHNSQSGGQNKSTKEWDELAQEDHTYRLTPEEMKRYQGHWYLTLNNAGKNGLCDFDPIFELQSLSKAVSTASQVNKLQNQFLHNNI